MGFGGRRAHSSRLDRMELREQHFPFLDRESCALDQFLCRAPVALPWSTSMMNPPRYFDCPLFLMDVVVSSSKDVWCFVLVFCSCPLKRGKGTRTLYICFYIYLNEQRSKGITNACWVGSLKSKQESSFEVVSINHHPRVLFPPFHL